MEDQREAIREIDEAIREAGRAAIVDGRDPRYQPPVDVNWRPADRLTRAMDALNSALRNLGYEEDNQAALGWRQAAIRDLQRRAHWLAGRSTIRRSTCGSTGSGLHHSPSEASTGLRAHLSR